MPGHSTVSHPLCELLLELCRLEQIAVAYHCDCGQRLVLANFEPSILRRETRGLGALVLQVSEHVACPQCGAPLATVWRAAEMVLAKDMIARLESLDAASLLRAVQIQLRAQEQARLRCN